MLSKLVCLVADHRWELHTTKDLGEWRVCLRCGEQEGGIRPTMTRAGVRPPVTRSPACSWDRIERTTLGANVEAGERRRAHRRRTLRRCV